MEEYKIIGLIAFLILSYLLMGYIFYRIGRNIERALNHHLYSRITNLQIENGKLQKEIDDSDKRERLLQTANEEMYDEGKKDVIKDTVKEMIADHDRLDFEKIVKKNTLKGEGEVGEDVGNILNRAGSPVHILLDDLHNS